MFANKTELSFIKKYVFDSPYNNCDIFINKIFLRAVHIVFFICPEVTNITVTLQTFSMCGFKGLVIM